MKTLQYKNHTIEIFQDELFHESFFDFMGSDVLRCLSHRRYNFDNDTEIVFDDYGSWDEVENKLKTLHPNHKIVPIFMYDHSGISFNTHRTCNWDSGQIGFLLFPELNATDEYINSFIENWNEYVSGQIYMYFVYENCECCGNKGDLVDSCTGYLGDLGIEQAEQDAKDAVDYITKLISKKNKMKPKKFNSACSISFSVDHNSEIPTKEEMLNALLKRVETLISENGFCCFQNFGSRNATTTFYLTQFGGVRVICGCFRGTLVEFECKVERRYRSSKFGREYKAIIDVARIKFGL